MKKKRMHRRVQTKRIYYNKPGKPDLYWEVRVSDAPRDVKINGTLLHALRGQPGKTVGCHLSNVAMDKNNADAFPHKCIYAYFTKSRCYIIDEVKNGQPYHAVCYSHSYGELVDLNDTDKSKGFIKSHPELADREFTLSKPRKPFRFGTRAHQKPGEPRSSGGSSGPRALYGALGRAVKAGLIQPTVAAALSR